MVAETLVLRTELYCETKVCGGFFMFSDVDVSVAPFLQQPDGVAGKTHAQRENTDGFGIVALCHVAESAQLPEIFVMGIQFQLGNQLCFTPL